MYAPNKEFTWYGNFVNNPKEMDIENLPKEYIQYIEQAEQVVKNRASNLKHVDEGNMLTFFETMKQRIGTNYNPEYKQHAQVFLERKQTVKKTDKLIKLMENLDL